MSWWTTTSRTFDALDKQSFEIMRIVTSAVCIHVAMTLSKRRSLFAAPNFCGTLAVLTHADAQCLCAVRACSLSELRWLDSKGRRLSVASCI